MSPYLDTPACAPSPEQTVAGFVVAVVNALGPDTVFCLTGGMAMYLNRAIATQPGLATVYCHHEQACVAAAQGYALAHARPRLGFALVTSGPGVTNTITSLCSAYGDSTPLVVLAGQIKTADIDTLGLRTHGAQEVRSLEIVAPCVKLAKRLTVAGLETDLPLWLAEAMGGRPGPVFIEIPLDVQNSPFPHTSLDVTRVRQVVLDQLAKVQSGFDVEKMASLLTWLSEGARPVIYLGGGCRLAGAGPAALAFAEEASIPVTHSWVTSDMIGRDHRLNFGPPGGLAPTWSNRILFDADRVLFLGARLDLGTTAFQRDAFGAQAARVMVDVDTAELAKFDGLERVETFPFDLSLFAKAVEIWRQGYSSSVSHQIWSAACTDLRAEGRAEEQQKLSVARLTTYTVGEAIAAWNGAKVLVCTGSGAASETFIRFFHPPQGTRFFFGGSLGAMGLALPHAVGACFAGQGRVACLDGDGGLMLNLQELATLAAHRPKGFVLFVLNNGGYLSIKTSQARHFGAVEGATSETGLFLPAADKLSAAFNFDHHRVETLEALHALLPRLLQDGPPCLVELVLDQNEHRGPSVKTIIHPDGRIASSSLAEIAW